MPQAKFIHVYFFALHLNELTKTNVLSTECHHHSLEENLHFGDKCSENQQVVLLGALNEPLMCGYGDNSRNDSVASQNGSNNRIFGS